MSSEKNPKESFVSKILEDTEITQNGCEFIVSSSSMCPFLPLRMTKVNLALPLVQSRCRRRRHMCPTVPPRCPLLTSQPTAQSKKNTVQCEQIYTAVNKYPGYLILEDSLKDLLISVLYVYVSQNLFRSGKSNVTICRRCLSYCMKLHEI